MNKYLSNSLTNAAQKAQRTCMLQSTNMQAATVALNAGLNTIGRSRETGIKDVRCSKRQLELDVDITVAKAKLKVLGANPCGLNGFMAMKNTQLELKHGDILEMVYGKHAYKLVFEPAPMTAASVNTTTTVAADETTTADNAWESVENGKMLVFNSAGVRAAAQIAAYDLDGTIIKTKSGNVFAKNIDDWELWHSEVRNKLKRLHENGYKICFFTNQAGIAKGKVNLDEFKQKILQIIKRLCVPVQVFIAISDGLYRKPLPGMWQHLAQHQNAGVQLKLEKCFFVGDAAGRPEIGTGASKRKKDHSLVDRLFAANVGITFYTPEEHFLSKKQEPWTLPEFEPAKLNEHVPLLEPENSRLPSDECEMIIMVGLPGSGKSNFVQTHIATLGYTVANADTLGSTQACLKACERALANGTSCVVDNTNVDAESRAKFIALAKQHKVPCRCFVMNVTLAHVKHNLAFRNLTDETHAKIKEMILNMMKKKYKAPALTEGFGEIVKVNFKPKFEQQKHAELYKMYLVEK